MFEVITGRVANPAALTQVTMNTGDTAAVRSFGDSISAYLENIWTQQATAGFARVRSPRMHDNVQGIRLAAPAALPLPLLPVEANQRVYQTDTLTIELQGGGAETDAIALQMYYDGMTTGAAKLANWDQIKPLIKNLGGVQVDVAGPTTTGDWSAGTNLTNFTDQWHADTYYAILGYELDTASLAVGIKGPDTGNYRVGGPGALQPIDTRDWFVECSRLTGLPHIPVIQSQNKGSTQVHVAKVGAGGTINVTLVVAELSGAAGG
jgi:hypothetical protein